MALEEELRPLLNRVRLVAELDLSLKGETYGKARSASGRLIERGGIGSLRVVCPSALVIFLVAEGVHRYAGGRSGRMFLYADSPRHSIAETWDWSSWNR